MNMFLLYATLSLLFNALNALKCLLHFYYNKQTGGESIKHTTKKDLTHLFPVPFRLRSSLVKH
jgi:hypothetical protein